MPVSQMGSQCASAADLRMELLPSTAWPQVAPVWRELARTCPHCSFFLSDVWVETWIQAFASELDVSIVIFTAQEGSVGACLLVKTRPGWAVVRCRRISLNASGEAASDATYIEYNDLLCRKGWERAVAVYLAEFLLMHKRWDEIALDGFAPGPAYEAFKLPFARCELEEVWHPSYYVDLRALRRCATSFEMTLGRTTRKHLRQSIRSYSEIGGLQLEAAEDKALALAMFDELAELNRRRWEQRSRYPVFASPRFISFHRSLITKCFAQKAVELLRLSAGRQTVGLIYNLVHDGSVYFYQCGLDYSIDPRLSPGILTLSLAIQRSLDCGLDTFDFLSGEASYKKRLATGSRRLVWATFRRPGLRMDLRKLVKTSRRWLLTRTVGSAVAKG